MPQCQAQLVQPFRAGQDPNRQPAHQITDHTSEGVHHQVIYIKDTVASLIEEVQAG